jgi:hypothetical protein
LFGQELGPELERIAPQVARTNLDARTAANALQNVGWVPLITPAGQTDAPASVRADETGALEFFGRAPSIYAYGAVEPYAEILDAHHARLSPASVGAAVQRGLSVPDILARLQHVQRGPVSPKLVQRIKAWGKFYGDARMGQLTLIEFRDDAARQELLADPDLKNYLTPFDAGARPLALVHAQDIARVRTLLAERGVELEPFRT